LREELRKAWLGDLLINKFIIQTITMQIFILWIPTFHRHGDLLINKFIIQTITTQIFILGHPHFTSLGTYR
jgi:hypothetical protein